MYLHVVACVFKADMYFSCRCECPCSFVTLAWLGEDTFRIRPLNVSAEICRFSSLTYKAVVVEHEAGVYFYRAIIMWLGKPGRRWYRCSSPEIPGEMLLTSRRLFPPNSETLTDCTYAKLSLRTMLTQSNYSSPQLSSDPQAWGVILVLFRPTHLNETAHSAMWPLHSKWSPLLKMNH